MKKKTLIKFFSIIFAIILFSIFIGSQPGDVIKEINRVQVRNLRDYQSLIKKSGRNKPVLFLIKRGGQTFYTSLKVS